ncbi:hypothetical protein M422DRAFT_239743 [Sphaerobolus stellatus SS14]|nr:hypothetical protein M422DRAFT_239743 [Sphaerobolus stellatus SS14]
MSSSRARNGWDPWLIIAQIITMQAIHYFTLCLLVPLLLNVFAEPRALEYDGGAANVGMIMDWREMSSRATWTVRNGSDAATSGTQRFGEGIDPRRGWCIALAWLGASLVDTYYLYFLVRRPRLILDFAVTLVVNHVILTTYYAAAFPSAVWFWVVMGCGGGATTVLGEQLCVRREMQEGLTVRAESGESVELPLLRRED